MCPGERGHFEKVYEMTVEPRQKLGQQMDF